MLLPVGVVVAFVAHGALMRVRADVCAHIVHAHDAQRTVLGSANAIVHVVSAADAAAGAGGFSRVVVSGAHANIVTQRPPHVKGRRWKFEYFFGAYISPQPADASQSLSASQSSRLIRLAASLNASLLALRSASSCALRSSRSRSALSSHIGQRLSV